MSGPPALILSLFLLLLALLAAARPSARAPEALVASGGALLLLVLGAISLHRTAMTLRDLGPTVAFLAALLVMAEGCRREGVFTAIGARLSGAAGEDPLRLLGLVFAFASLVTAVLSLDATVILLTPVVVAALGTRPWRRDPHLMALPHLANSASLLLPVSNLTNLLAFHDSRLSFTRFTALMALPWLAAIGAEWLSFRIVFRRALARHWPGHGQAAPAAAPPGALPLRALLIVGATLIGFAVTSPLGVAPVWVAAAGALALNLPVLRWDRSGVSVLVRAAQPGFLVFVLALGVIVAAASLHGLGSAARALLPGGSSLGVLLLTAAVGALAANLLNNLPATLLLVPVAAAGGAAPVLAVLLGVNIGPNLTPVGSLATLLWARVLRAQRERVQARSFLILGALSVPAALLAAGTALWLAAKALL